MLTLGEIVLKSGRGLVLNFKPGFAGLGVFIFKKVSGQGGHLSILGCRREYSVLLVLLRTAAAPVIEGFLSQAGPEAVKYMKEGGAEMKKELKKIKRVVVRGDSAVAIFEGNNQWAKFVKEDGEWKSDD